MRRPTRDRVAIASCSAHGGGSGGAEARCCRRLIEFDARERGPLGPFPLVQIRRASGGLAVDDVLQWPARHECRTMSGGWKAEHCPSPSHPTHPQLYHSSHNAAAPHASSSTSAAVGRANVMLGGSAARMTPKTTPAAIRLYSVVVAPDSSVSS